MALRESFDPYALARGVANQLELATWRGKIAQDERTQRWEKLFALIEPEDEPLIELTATLLKASGGTIPGYLVYGMILSAWTYGYSAACSALADEDIALWTGQPFQWPQDMGKAEDES